MKERQIPKPGEFYCHFKKKYYQILAIAKHSETREDLVIYQALYGDFGVYARPLDMFLSEVDREKYPDVSQTYRFEKVEKPGVSVIANGIANEANSLMESNQLSDSSKLGTDKELVQENGKEKQVASVEGVKTGNEKADTSITEAFMLDEEVERFLDADTYKEKLDILMSLQNHITDKQLHDMAITLDITIDEGTVDDKFQNLVQCLRTMARFEIGR